MKELEKERDLLKERRDALDAQLNDNQVLNVEVRTKGVLCVWCKFDHDVFLVHV